MLSTSDDKRISVNKNRDNLTSTKKTKKTKRNDDYDYSSDDTENMTDSSTEPDTDFMMDKRILLLFFHFFYKLAKDYFLNKTNEN
jgi:hypothetical protein